MRIILNAMSEIYGCAITHVINFDNLCKLYLCICNDLNIVNKIRKTYKVRFLNQSSYIFGNSSSNFVLRSTFYNGDEYGCPEVI